MGGNPPPLFIVQSLQSLQDLKALQYHKGDAVVAGFEGIEVSYAGDYTIFFYYLKSLMMILSSSVSIC